VVQALGHRSSPPRINESNSERKDFSSLLLNCSLPKQGTHNTFSEKIGRSPSLLIPHREMSSILCTKVGGGVAGSQPVSTEPVIVNLLRSPGFGSQYDNPFCCTGPPGYIGWRNRFLGIGFVNVYKYGLSCTQGAQINFGDLTPYLTYG
jgi:hypothetical protein